MKLIANQILDISVHCIPFQDEFLLYDARSFSIIRCNPCTAAVAVRASGRTLVELVKDLQADFDPKDIIEAFLMLRKLADSDVLATREPVAPQPPGLRSLTLLLAGGCNMACEYCFESDKPTYQKLNLLSIETANRVLSWFATNHRHNHMHLQLYGGEPLLNWPVLKHVVNSFSEIARENSKTHSIYMITNGTLLTEDRCDYLIANGVEIQISLDGDAKANAHRVLRGGTGTFEKVSRWIPYLKQKSANFNVRAVVTPTQPDPEIAIASLEELGAPKATYGVVSTRKKHLRFEGNDLSRLEDLQHAHINKRMTEYSVSFQEARAPANVRALARRIDQGSLIHFHCNAGVTEVTVTHDAQIFECQRLMGSSIGSIDDPGWYDSASKFLVPVFQKQKCSGCFARYNCGGGCKEANVVYTGEDHAWPQYCNIKRKEVEAAIVYSYLNAKRFNSSYSRDAHYESQRITKVTAS